MKLPNWYVPAVRPGQRVYLGADIKDTQRANEILALKTIAEALVIIANSVEKTDD